MPVLPYYINPSDPNFTGSVGTVIPQPTTTAATASKAWAPGGPTGIVVLPGQAQTTGSVPFVGNILFNQVNLNFDLTDDEYLQPLSETPTQDLGMLVQSGKGILGVPSDIRVFDRKLEDDVVELLPPLPPVPPFRPPVLRPDFTSTRPIGILAYNVLDQDLGRLDRFDDVVAVERSNVLLLADAYNYIDEDGNEVERGLTYDWRIDGKLVSNKRFLYFPEIERLDTDPFSKNSYYVQLEVSNEIGTVVNAVNLKVWGGEENNNLIDLDPSIPFQIANGFYWFWDETQERLVKVSTSGQVFDPNGNPLNYTIDPTVGQVPTKPPTVKFTTITGNTYEYNVDSSNIQGILRRTKYIEVLPRAMVGIWGRKNFKGGNYFFFNYSQDTIYKIELPTSKRDVRSVKIRYFNNFNNYLDPSATKNVQWPTSITRRKFDMADMLHWLGDSPTDAELVNDLKRFE